ncbi:nuclear transport factor 2 family protein [Vibrio mediterranei]|jgi:hypothetical protein|uniref:nuclear transport factor 2 family protein n=1 Tax=Vibrio mediterranei TaxID=689 RepID=UPI002283FA23|nr:nuclear transport factor 2 family protein [Vibrio mediterranei]MCY9856178.1 nuclear transport factor 2 family protein [Vibrio mediterranei]
MRSISTLSAAAILVTGSVSAEEVKLLGTPITMENVVDVMEVQRVVANLTDSADSARWNHVRELLDDKVDTTIGETEPGVSKVKSNEEIATRWAAFFENADRFVMHHITSNERVFFEDKNNVTVYSKGVITLENTPAGAYAEDGGTLRGYRWVSYEFGLTRKTKGWKVNKVFVEYKMEEFDSLPPKK